MRLAGKALSVAPKEHFDILIALLDAIKNEIAWFKVLTPDQQGSQGVAQKAEHVSKEHSKAMQSQKTIEHIMIRLQSRVIGTTCHCCYVSIVQVSQIESGSSVLLQEQAKKQGVDLGAVRSLPVTAKYVDLMKSWQEKPYPALATALWGIEYSYYKASSQYLSTAAKFDLQKCLNLFKSKVVT